MNTKELKTNEESGDGQHYGSAKTDLFWWLAWGESSYQVIGTDYDNYALIYGCDSWFGVIYTQRSWLLSRTPTMTSSQEKKAKSVMDSKVGDKYDYETKWKNFGTECGFGIKD